MNKLTIALPTQPTHEEAQAHLQVWLRDKVVGGGASFKTNGSFQFSLTGFLQNQIAATNTEALEAYRSAEERPSVVHDLVTNSAPYFDVAWELARRGILVPVVIHNAGAFRAIADEYRLSPYGLRWAGQLSNDAVLPTETSRFSTLLMKHSARYGPAYVSRGQEALACYGGQHYLASCTMSGAAAEAIVLALAVARIGDEAKVLADYRTQSGTSKVLKALGGQLKEGRRQELETFFSLLKYWRDGAAHATAADFDEEAAFTSLILLLRFAHYGEARWNELTGKASA